MEAKSAALRKAKPRGASSQERRLPYEERRASILRQASEFFSEYGLTGQTRSLALACGVSQRLLYRFFPSKAALLREVYDETIIGPFKAVWLAQLADRSHPVEQRLNLFYRDYFGNVLTRKWLRLFLYASLAESAMAPDYIAAIIKHLLETITRETALEQGVELPEDPALMHEIGWTLHGAVSHFAIRRHLYGASLEVSEDRVLAMHVGAFVSGFAGLVDTARRHEPI
jgi:AcrR family transcriptional regulator